VFKASKLTTAQAKDGMKAFLKAKEIDIIASMKVSIKSEIGLSVEATELTSIQIQKIVYIIVELK